jgi:hypothetical protein
MSPSSDVRLHHWWHKNDRSYKLVRDNGDSDLV